MQALVRERAQHERAVRLAWAATPGAGGRATSVVRRRRWSQHLGDRVLVQLVDVDGTLHAVVVRDGRWRTVRVGPADAGREGRRRRALRAAHRHPRSARSTWPGWASGWRRRCSGTSARLLPARSPGGRLTARPPCSPRRGRCCRPALPAGRAHPVGDRLGARARGPAALLAGRARGRPGPADRRRRGRARSPGCTRAPSLLAAGDATVAAALAALDGAALGHIAAHGSFRAGDADVLQPPPRRRGDDRRRRAPARAPAAPDRAARLPVGSAARRSAATTSSASPPRCSARAPPGSSPRSPTSTTPPPCR